MCSSDLEWPRVVLAYAKSRVLAPTGAIENIHVGRFLFLRAIERLNFVVFRMATAMSNLLILLQRFNVFDGQQPHQLFDGVTLTGRNMCHQVIVKSDAPKSSVIVSPAATVNVEA